MSQHRPDPDDAFDRLRAADPAAGLEPDAASLDAAVRHRVGATPHEPAAAPAGDLERVRAGRRPSRWAAVAAVAAGTLVVGSVGGYALGSRDDGTASTAAGAISLPGAGAAAESSALGEGAARSGAADVPAIASDASASSSYLPWFGGRTVFSASGLSDETGIAEAWAYDPSQVFGAQAAARVAASLGLAGEPRLEGGTWVVGPQDGSGPSLQLQPDGVSSVSYYDPALDPFGCPQALPVPETAAEGADGPVVEPGPRDLDVAPCEPRESGPAPQGEAAVARARDVLADAGGDPERYEYEVGDSGTPDAVYVTAFEVVAGQRSGLAWSLTLVGDGVQSLYGGLAPVVPLGSYEVVSPVEAVARLSDPRFGAGGGGMVAAGPSAAVAQDAASSVGPVEPAPDAEVPPPTPPATVTPGAALGWPVVEVTLTSARLGLAQHTLPTGATVLLPAYELADAGGATWSVVAVADERLDFSPAG